jgi:transcriptional regulator with XRE-family HTH domain
MAPAAASAPAIAAVPDPKVEPSPTAEAAREVRGNLGWSDGQLARLFGLSRQGWRDWVRGSATPRPKNRKRLYFLRQLLLVRATVAPNARPSVWFESPIAAGRAETPADLFQTGRDALVAALAAAGPTPESGTYMLDRGLELGGLVNTKAAEAAMLEAAAISSEDRA